LYTLSDAASGYHKVLEENRKLYNQIQDLKGIILCIEGAEGTGSKSTLYINAGFFCPQEILEFIVESGLSFLGK